MSLATEFYLRISRMSKEDLIEYEDSLFNTLHKTTNTYKFALKTCKDITKYEEKQANAFMALLTVRSYMYENSIPLPERVISEYMLSTAKLKDGLEKLKRA